MTQDQLARDSLAQELTRALPESIKPCADCAMSRFDVVICRVSNGHSKDLAGPRKDLVNICHSRFLRKQETKHTVGNHDSVMEDLIHPYETQIQDRVRDDDFIMAAGSSLTWLADIPPSEKKCAIVDQSSAPDIEYSLKKQYALGYSGLHVHRNLIVLYSGEIVYTAGSSCVILNVPSKKQRLFSGHTDKVLCLVKHPHETNHLIASGQGGQTPTIFLWNVSTLQVLFKVDGFRQILSVPDVRGKLQAEADPLPVGIAIRALDFAPCGQYLMAICDDANNTLAMYGSVSKPGKIPWTSCQLLCWKSSGQTRVLDIKFNAFSGEFVTCGVKHMVFWKIDGHKGFWGRNASFGQESYDATFCCVEFLSANQTLTGSACGALWLWSGLRLSKIIYDAHSGPLFDIKADGPTVVTVGQDANLRFWNFAASFESVPVGDLTKGDFLTKNIDLELSLLRHEKPWAEHLVSDGGLGPIRTIAWHNHYMFCGTRNNHILMVDDRDGSSSFLVAGHYGEGIRGLCTIGHLPWLISAGATGVLIIRDLQTAEILSARNFNRKRPISKKLTEDRQFLEGEYRKESEILQKLVAESLVSVGGTSLPVSNLRKFQLEVNRQRQLIRTYKTRLEAVEDKIKYSERPFKISCINVSRDGKIVAIGMDDGGLAEVELKYSKNETLLIENLFTRIFQFSQRSTTCLKFSPDDEMIVVGYSDGHVRVFAKDKIDVDIEPLFSFKCNSAVTNIDWDSSSIHLRCNDDRQRFYIFELGDFPKQSDFLWASNSCIFSWSTHGIFFDSYLPEDVKSLVDIPSKSMFVVGDVNGVLSLFKSPCLGVGARRAQIFGHCAPVNLIASDRRNSFLVSADGDMNILLWNFVECVHSAKDQEVDAKINSKWVYPFSWIENDKDVDSTLTFIKCSAEHTFDHTDDSDVSFSFVPWMTMCQPPTKGMPGQIESPLHHSSFDLTLEHVYGYGGVQSKGNLILLPTFELLFTVMSLCVLQNIQNGKQRFFRGHQAPISSISLHPRGNIVASGDAENISTICIWSCESADWSDGQLLRPLVRLTCSHSRQTSALSFSSDGELLLSVGVSRAEPENIIAVYQWNSKNPSLLAVHSFHCQKIFTACFNPYNDEIITCGVAHCKFWTVQGSHIEELTSHIHDEFYDWAVAESGLCSCRSDATILGAKLATQTALCIECVDSHHVITGTVDGLLLIWRNHFLMSIIPAHKGPIFDMHCPSKRRALQINIQFKSFGESQKKWWERSGQRIGQFSDEIKKGMIIQESEDVVIFAGTQAVGNTSKIVLEAIEHFFTKREKENGLRQGDYFDVHFTCTNCDPTGFVTGGKDGRIIVWSMQKDLRVGFKNFNMLSMFNSFGTKDHKREAHDETSSTYMTLEAFLSCLVSCDLIQDYMDFSLHAPTASHPKILKAEATRIFRDVLERQSLQQSKTKICFEGFNDALERVAGLISLKRYSYPFDYVESIERRHKELESELESTEAWSGGTYAESCIHTLARIKSEIQSLSRKIQATKVCVRLVAMPLKQNEVDMDTTNKSKVYHIQRLLIFLSFIDQ